MTVINTNTAAINAQYNLSKVQSEQENAMERLSSGLRINSASDDAAGVAIASRMNAEITGTNMAIRNAMDSQAMIDTAEGAHVEVESILQRMRELAVQSANDTYSDSDRTNLQAELSQLQTEVDRIAMATNWGGKGLLNGTSLSTPSGSHGDKKTFQFQVGTGSATVNSIDVSIGAISSGALGVGVGNAAASVGNASVESSSIDAPAAISINGGKVAISGKPQVGDVFKFDVNGEEISVTYSVSDTFADNLSGLSAQMKAALETKINSVNVSPSLSAVSVVDNGDGSISLSQSATPVISDLTNNETSGTTGNNSAIDVDGNTVRMSGSFDAGDKFGVSINGVAIEITAATTGDAFSDDFSGLSAQLKAAIDANTTINGTVSVTDNKDGSVTITQGTSPVIQAAETTLSKTQTTGLSFSTTQPTTNADIKVTEAATPTDNEVNVVVLKSGVGSDAVTLTIGARTTGTAAGDTAQALKAAFDGVDADDRKGFTASINTAGTEVTFSRTDGQEFSIEKGAATSYKGVEITAPNFTGTAARQIILNGAFGASNPLTLSDGGSQATVAASFDAMFSAFHALTEAEKNGYLMQKQTASGVGNTATTGLHIYRTDATTFTVDSNVNQFSHDEGTAAAANQFTANVTTGQIDIINGHASSNVTAESGDVYTLTLGGAESLAIVGTARGAGETHEIMADIKAQFDLLSTAAQKGYTLVIASNALQITRTDSQDFTAAVSESSQGGSDTATFQETVDGASQAAHTGTASSTANAREAASISATATLASNLKEDVTTTPAVITTTAVSTVGEGHGGGLNESTLTFTGGYVAGKEYSADIFGTNVSIVAKDDDGFENSLNGLASQFTQAVNDAGIAGVKAASYNQYVELSAKAVITDAVVVKDQTTVSGANKASITVDSTVDLDDRNSSITLGGTIENGDEFSFAINGTSIGFKIGADGYSNTDAGVRAQLKAAIETAGITGIVVTEGTGRDVKIEMPMTTLSNSKSTIVTNASVTDTPNATLTIVAKDGSVKVAGEVANGDKFDFSVEGQSFSVVAGADGAEASAKGVAGQIATVVKAANIASLEVTEDGNGGVLFSTTDVKITNAQAAKDSIAVIDAAIETINKQRANLGGVSNRLDNTVTNLSNVSANLQSSLSRIQDADFATETSNLTKSQILSQAATAMLAQANASKQGVLSLLQG